MDYNLDMCSAYEHHKIGSKNIYLFDNHNMALPVWGTYSSDLQKPLNLITFDAHVDTRAPFTRLLTNECFNVECKYNECLPIKDILGNAHYKREDFCFEDVWRISMDDVSNDEHIRTAVVWGYLESYTVVCDLSADEIKDYQSDDVDKGLNVHYIQRNVWFRNADSVIERLGGLPVALDFDLDYFHCVDDLSDEFWNSITPLIRQSNVITVAREPNYFEYLKTDSNLSNKSVQEKLLQNIKRIVNNI